MIKTVNAFLLGIIFLPLSYLVYASFDALSFTTLSKSALIIANSHTLFNSLQLSLPVAAVSTLLAFFTTLVYYHIKEKNIRYLFLILLLFLFATAPIIYASLFAQIDYFNALTPFARSIIVLVLWLTPLGSTLIILMLRYIDHTSLQLLDLLPISQHVIFTKLIAKQMLLSFSGLFLLLFMMAFVQEEVPSFFGYRTYAEDFLSRIILMEDFASIIVYALPFVLLAAGGTLFFYLLLKKYFFRLFNDLLSPLEHLSFSHFHYFSKLGILFYVAVTLLLFFGLGAQLEYSKLISLLSENALMIFETFVLVLLAALSATALAFYLVRTFNHSLLIIMAFSSLYWFLPPSLNALIILELSQLLYFDNDLYGYFLLLYGYILRVLPVALVIMMLTAQHHKKSPLFKLLKLSGRALFFTIELPLQWKKWLLTFIVVFFLILNEVSITVLLVPAGFETIIIKIYNLLHYGDAATVAFLSLVQSLLVMLLLTPLILLKDNHDHG